MLRSRLTVFVLCLFINVVKLEKYLPILIWHCAGEASDGFDTQVHIDFIKSLLGNEVYIKSACLGENDKMKSLTIHPIEQINFICDTLKSDPKFANGYNAIGISQGGLLIRGLAQLCTYPPMRNLISLAGPQQGLHEYPTCGARFGTFCSTLHWAISNNVYSPLSQKFVTAATYWHDLDEERYRKGSTFLAVLNNENEYNQNLVDNLHRLKRMVLVKYTDDKAIVPNSSSWFGWYDETGTKQVPMEQTSTYIRDRLGLKYMQESGKIVLLLCEGEHMQLQYEWFVHNIMPVLMDTQ